MHEGPVFFTFDTAFRSCRHQEWDTFTGHSVQNQIVSSSISPRSERSIGDQDGKQKGWRTGECTNAPIETSRYAVGIISRGVSNFFREIWIPGYHPFLCDVLSQVIFIFHMVMPIINSTSRHDSAGYQFNLWPRQGQLSITSYWALRSPTIAQN